jgi:hypothetical protein
VRSNTLAIGLGVLGVIFVVVAVLYAVGGVLPTFTSSPVAGFHGKHTILFVVLALASFVGANMTRVKTV